MKKASLDREDFRNYRPISSLPFISKVLEKIVVHQTIIYLNTNNLQCKLQSAYRKNHSTETALIHVQNNILRALDQHQEVLLIMLDLSSAFDTIDHSTLLKRFHHRFGFSDTVLKWFTSYLSQRSQSVIINGIQSPKLCTSFGVPQGSVLGPLLFTLYITPLEDLIASYGLSCMFYADDTQLYVMFNPTNRESSISSIEHCVSDIIAWNNSNLLVTNKSKTEVVHFSSRFSHSLPISNVNINGSLISPTPKSRNLGVILDSHTTMNSQVNFICSKASQSIRSIGQIRKYLDQSTTEKLVHAFVTSKIDYCNSLLYGLPSTLLLKIQRLQNTAARLVTKTKKSDHITPVLINLHWLPIVLRINFKILLLTYKALHGLAPAYLIDLLQPKHSTRNLRFKHNLLTPRSFTVNHGDRAFSICAPKLWNNLPEDVKTCETLQCFKSKVKTYLFNIFSTVSSYKELYTRHS